MGDNTPLPCKLVGAGAVRRAVDRAGNALGAAAKGFEGAVRGAADKVGSAWKSGNFRGLGRMTGEATFQVATTVVPVGNVAKLGLAARLAGAGSKATSFAGRAGGSLSRATSSAQRFVGAAKRRLIHEIEDIGHDFAIRRATRSAVRDVDSAIARRDVVRLGSLGAGRRESVAALGRRGAMHRGNIIDGMVKRKVADRRGLTHTPRGRRGVDLASRSGRTWDITTRRQRPHHLRKYPGARLIFTTPGRL